MSILHVCTYVCENLVSARVQGHDPTLSPGRDPDALMAAQEGLSLCYSSLLPDSHISLLRDLHQLPCPADKCPELPRNPQTPHNPDLISTFNHPSLLPLQPILFVQHASMTWDTDILTPVTPASCPDTEPYPCPCQAWPSDTNCQLLLSSETPASASTSDYVKESFLLLEKTLNPKTIKAMLHNALTYFTYKHVACIFH